MDKLCFRVIVRTYWFGRYPISCKDDNSYCRCHVVSVEKILANVGSICVLTVSFLCGLLGYDGVLISVDDFMLFCCVYKHLTCKPCVPCAAQCVQLSTPGDQGKLLCVWIIVIKKGVGNCREALMKLPCWGDPQNIVSNLKIWLMQLLNIISNLESIQFWGRETALC